MNHKLDLIMFGGECILALAIALFLPAMVRGYYACVPLRLRRPLPERTLLLAILPIRILAGLVAVGIAHYIWQLYHLRQ